MKKSFLNFKIQINHNSLITWESKPRRAAGDAKRQINEQPSFANFGTTANHHFTALVENATDKLIGQFGFALIEHGAAHPRR